MTRIFIQGDELRLKLIKMKDKSAIMKIEKLDLSNEQSIDLNSIQKDDISHFMGVGL